MGHVGVQEKMGSQGKGFVLAVFFRVLSSKYTRLQHCYVTGGSSGLGLALAVRLARNGAHVSIVARDQGKLNNALAEIEVCGVCLRLRLLNLHAESSPNARSNFSGALFLPR